MRRNEFGARRTPVGITFRSTLSVEVWTAEFRVASRNFSTSRWQIGDLLLHGEQAQYGKAYEQAIDETGLSYQTVANVKAVCRRFTISRRRENLSFGHHAEIVSLPGHIQDRLLDKAVEAHWSRNTLREEVATIKRRRRPLGTELSVGSLSITAQPCPTPIAALTPDRSSVVPIETRAEALIKLSALLDIEPDRTLHEIVRVLLDARSALAELPKQKRIAHARGFLLALGLTDADLRPIG